MSTGELLTRSTIWISILSYVLGAIAFALRKQTVNIDAITRVAWTIGIGALVAHFATAFHFYHHWSQLDAYRETARQTNEVFGLNWGGGLFINYGLLALWIADVGWWWARGLESYRLRPLPIVLLWHGFVVFILFNALVVFKDGWQRWAGVVICIILCWAWIRTGIRTATKHYGFTKS